MGLDMKREDGRKRRGTHEAKGEEKLKGQAHSTSLDDDGFLRYGKKRKENRGARVRGPRGSDEIQRGYHAK